VKTQRLKTFEPVVVRVGLVAEGTSWGCRRLRNGHGSLGRAGEDMTGNGNDLRVGKRVCWLQPRRLQAHHRHLRRPVFKRESLEFTGIGNWHLAAWEISWPKAALSPVMGRTHADLNVWPGLKTAQPTRQYRRQPGQLQRVLL